MVWAPERWLAPYIHDGAAATFATSEASSAHHREKAKPEPAGQASVIDDRLSVYLGEPDMVGPQSKRC